MRRDLLISAGPGEWRAAWLEDGIAVELHVERGDHPPAGSIHLGRVVRRVAGLGAALVDIATERPGFLPLRRSDPERFDEGARVLVQVHREAQRDKGARLTTQIVGHDPAGLAEAGLRLDPPARLFPLPGFATALRLRLPAEPDRLVTDDPALVAELRQAFPKAEIAQPPPDEWPIDLDAVFDAALAPSLPLEGGGSIHIEECRAVVLVDVDTGTPEAGGSAQRTMLAANLAAAQVVAQQLRLRQLGGGIVIDFIGLEGRGPREKLRQAMTGFITGDPAHPEVLGWTRLGHLELVRPRRGRPLSDAMLEPQAAGKSALTLAFEALRLLYRAARAEPAADWRLTASPAMIAVLQGPAATALHALETRLGRGIAVTPGNTPTFDIAPL